MLQLGNGSRQERMNFVLDTMREISSHTDPDVMMRTYGARMRQVMNVDRSISLSRRGLEAPRFRVTRYSGWTEAINPWTEKDRLPLLAGGVFADLLYSDEPRIIDDLDVPADDPAYEYLAGQRSLAAVPHYDGGKSINMVVFTRAQPRAFDHDAFPGTVWMSNLFGRAMHNLVLRNEVEAAFRALDREMSLIADIQRSLLPETLPAIPTMELAAHYQTSSRAGGDYYDIYPLPDGRWALLIADVAGHGSPAAVLMAILHSIVHTHPDAWSPAGAMLAHANRLLARRYTQATGSFVTAFYGLYDPKARELTYATAGHGPPRLKRCDAGTMAALDAVAGLPLGVVEDERYEEATHTLHRGDQLIFYTDGITEARNPAGEMFGLERVDDVLEACRPDANALIAAVLSSLDAFTAGRPAEDDRTLIVAKIR